MQITYSSDLSEVDWMAMKREVAADKFDNGRTPQQLQRSFENSSLTCIAYAAGRIVGTARALSDGVCNAYLVDVWTQSDFRRRGIGRTMIETLLANLQGQHVYLFSDDQVEFYKKIGFIERPTGLQKVVGMWLFNKA